MHLSPQASDAVRQALDAGPGAGLDVRAVSGGCISPAARVACGERQAFVKWAAPDTPTGLFVQEASSLDAIGATGVMRVPAVLHASDDALVLEWLEPGRASEDGWREFGRTLARMHRVHAQAHGWPQDNFIGPLPQANDWCASWPEFFAERRIMPQLERAFAGGHFDRAQRETLTGFQRALYRLLPDAPPSLLHGDLWSGNAHALASGAVALIDPASCHGDREMDLAMAGLFGGFPSGFFESYEQEWPTPSAGRRQRRAAYAAYYLLVHVNLFGSGYEARTLAAVREAMAG